MLNLGSVSGFMIDCDGTLLDALDAWVEAERDLFAQATSMTDEDEAEIHTAPIDEAAVIMHDKHGIGESAEAVLAHLDAHLLPYYRDEARALPGVVKFVRLAHNAGIPCVVVSSSPHRYLEEGLKRVGIRDCFKALVSTEDTRSSKLDSKIYEEALKVLGTSRETTWAIDDAPYAIAAMHDCGLKTICVGSRDAEMADINVSSFEELL